MTELMWDGKYSADGRRAAPSRVALPFRTVELVGDSARQCRRARGSFDTGRKGAGSPGGEGAGSPGGEGAGSPGGEGAGCPGGEDAWRNRLICGDATDVLPSLLPEFAGKVDLIYVDPPFHTGAGFSCAVRIPTGDALSATPVSDGDACGTAHGPGCHATRTKGSARIERRAYQDTWGRGLDGYLRWFYDTVALLHELLAPTGSIYVHLDWRLDYVARCVMDEVFGPQCFRNAIVWKRDVAGKGAKRMSRQWPRNADVILFYSRSPTCWTFNQQFVPLNDHQKKAYRYADATGRRYKAVQLGDYSAASIARLEAEGLIHSSRCTGTKYRKYYLDEALATVDGLWTDIPGFGTRTAAAEQVGYPTQKPAALLERIIRASSNEGDLVLDCCCGSGTTAAVAERLGRRWIAADLGRFAIQTSRKRLLAIPGVRPFEVQSLDKHAPPYVDSMALSLHVCQTGHSVTVGLTGFAMPLEGVPADVLDAITHWSQWIDYWAIDWDYRDDTYHNQWRSYRTREGPCLQHRAAHTYDDSGRYTIVVQAIDILGNDTTRRITVEVP